MAPSFLLSMIVLKQIEKHAKCIKCNNGAMCAHHYISYIYQSHAVHVSYQPHLIRLSHVITASKYVHVSIQGAAAGPWHLGRDFPCHVEQLPSEIRKNVVKWLKSTNDTESLYWNISNILTIHLALSHTPRFHHWGERHLHQRLTVKNTTCLLLWNKPVQLQLILTVITD